MKFRVLRARREQAGQAIPVGLAAIVMSWVLLTVTFNTGQWVAEKMRLSNTADAAVYSGMVWQARALNFQAYLNRAAVANQVAIGQLVSFLSYSRWLLRLTENANTIASLWPPARPVTAAIAGGADQVDRAVQRLSTLFIAVIDKVNAAIERSSGAVKTAAVASTWEVINSVIVRNDPRYELTTIGMGGVVDNAAELGRFTKHYTTAAALQRKAEVIADERSQDEFMTRRSWEWNPDLGLLEFFALDAELRKDGITRFMRKEAAPGSGRSPQWQWKAKDTLSLWAKIPVKKWLSGKRPQWVEVLPAGWGSALVSQSGNDLEPCGGRFRSRVGRRCPPWGRNEIAEALADAEVVNIGVAQGVNRRRQRSSRAAPVPENSLVYGGVRSYWDVRYDSRSSQDPRLTLMLEVRVAAEKVRTAGHIAGLGGGAAGLDEVYPDDVTAGPQMSAVSAAEVYFQRPARRRDNRDEYASLFNPYWDVHLVDATAIRRVAWAAALGMEWLPAGAGGSGSRSGEGQP